MLYILGAGFVSNKNDSNTNQVTNQNSNATSTLPRSFMRPLKPQRASLARVILSLESNAAKQQALQHILNALHILYAREAVVSALTPHGGQPSSSKLQSDNNPILDKVPLASPESPSDINEGSVNDLISGGGGEAPACPTDLSLQTSPDSEEPSTSNSEEPFSQDSRGNHFRSIL